MLIYALSNLEKLEALLPNTLLFLPKNCFHLKKLYYLTKVMSQKMRESYNFLELSLLTNVGY